MAMDNGVFMNRLDFFKYNGVFADTKRTHKILIEGRKKS